MKIKKIKPYLFQQKGQSLIEILIVTVVVAAVLTAIAAGLSMSAKNSAENKKLSIATTYAQEALEVFHRERSVLGWATFRDLFVDDTYCVATIPANSTEFSNLGAGECSPSEVIAGTDFLREVELSTTADQVKVIARVTWLDASKLKEVVVEQTFQEID